jgi:hypothetical protein
LDFSTFATALLPIGWPRSKGGSRISLLERAYGHAGRVEGDIEVLRGDAVLGRILVDVEVSSFDDEVFASDGPAGRDGFEDEAFVLNHCDELENSKKLRSETERIGRTDQ